MKTLPRRRFPARQQDRVDLYESSRGGSRSSTTTATCRRIRSRTTPLAIDDRDLARGRHYKWRAMRTPASRTQHHRRRVGLGKFAAWAATVPQTLRNPLYHWTHLELRSRSA
jgi:hypothetical protein